MMDLELWGVVDSYGGLFGNVVIERLSYNEISDPGCVSLKAYANYVETIVNPYASPRVGASLIFCAEESLRAFSDLATSDTPCLLFEFRVCGSGLRIMANMSVVSFEGGGALDAKVVFFIHGPVRSVLSGATGGFNG